jgi:hypothetical protein
MTDKVGSFSFFFPIQYGEGEKGNYINIYKQKGTEPSLERLGIGQINGPAHHSNWYCQRRRLK